MGDFGACDAAEALATAIDAEQVAARAREFLYKPDGGANAWMLRHSVSLMSPTPPDVSYNLGLRLDQDPLVYRQGTEFLMPGPAGNLFSVPDLPSVRRLLANQARKAIDIYQSVNFPRPPPDFLVRRSGLRLGGVLLTRAFVGDRSTCGTWHSAARRRWWMTRRTTRRRTRPLASPRRQHRRARRRCLQAWRVIRRSLRARCRSSDGRCGYVSCESHRRRSEEFIEGF